MYNSFTTRTHKYRLTHTHTMNAVSLKQCPIPNSRIFRTQRSILLKSVGKCDFCAVEKLEKNILLPTALCCSRVGVNLHQDFNIRVHVFICSPVFSFWFVQTLPSGCGTDEKVSTPIKSKNLHGCKNKTIFFFFSSQQTPSKCDARHHM